MVKIERRYQHRTRNGVEWTSWFVCSDCENIDEANKKIKELRSQKEADKKLLGEYRISEE